MSSDRMPNSVTNDATSDMTGSTTAAWIDDNPVGRCTASHVMSGPTGVHNARCDAQAGHGGDRHRATVNGSPVYWCDDAASHADESEENASAKGGAST